MNTMKSVFSKIAEDKTELSKEEVNLSALDDLKAAESAPNQYMDRAIALKKEAKQNFINAQNKYKEIVSLCDKYIPMAEDLGIGDAVKRFKNARKMANDMAKALNIDIKNL